MAQKKNSKKDLEDRVAKLKKKVATLTSSLTKKQSDLARTLSSVQKKLDKLRKHNVPRKEFASQSERQELLLQSTEGLTTRLRDIEQTVSMVERVSDDIQERTRALETGIAEATIQGDGSFQPAEASDGGQQHALDVLRQRTQALEDHLGRLQAAQEGLELQIALLSREAEDAGGARPTPDTHVAQGTRWSEGANEFAQLRTQYSLAEEVTGKLSRRTAVLEAGQEALVEQDTKLSDQLQEMEQRISELAEKSEQSGSAQSPLALEQQIALLNTDRSLNQSRIEEVLKRAEELASSRSDDTLHTDALADRITALSEQVQGLLTIDPAQRFDELATREVALEQSVQDEHERLDELSQSGQTLDQRLNAVVEDIASLQEKIGSLGSGGNHLNSEIVRLESELHGVDAVAEQHRERLQAHEVRLEEQRQRLDDAIEGNNKAGDGVNARFAKLDESRQTLQEETDALAVEQVRQGHDTNDLRQSVRRRTLIGLAALLAAAVLGFLLLRGPGLPEELQSALQAGNTADQEAAIAIADLEKDMGVLRREVVVLGDSLAQVARSMDELNEGTASELPGEVSRLTEMTEKLARQDLEQQQASQDLREGMGQRGLETSELRKGQEQLKEALGEIADKVAKLSEKAIEAPRLATLKPGGQGQVWTQAQSSGRYTLQLAGFHRRGSLERFLKRHGFGSDTAVFTTEYQGRPWYVVFHGIYSTVGHAAAAASQLPLDLASLGPWVRRVPNAGDIQPL